MGRTKTKSRTTRPAPSTSIPVPPQAAAKSKPKPTVPALLAKAHKLLAESDHDLARRFVLRALEMDAEHAEARELLGVVDMERGELESAKEIFLTLIPPSLTALVPPPPSAYMYLAQLLSDEDPRSALHHYQLGIDLSLSRMRSKGKARADESLPLEEDDEIKKTVVTACVSMVELWMTDLCFEPEAEQSCEEILRQALEVDPGNTEALLSLASVRMSQQRETDAEECVKQVWAAWEEIEAGDPSHPAPPTLLSFTRICLELKLYPLALAALTRTLEMDDQEVEAWYLEGWCFWLMAEDAAASAGGDVGVDGEEGGMGRDEMMHDARDCLDTCLMLHATQSHPDEQLLQHVKELLAELDALGIQPSSPDEEAVVGEEQDGDEWEDEDEDEDEDADGDVEMS